jgi:hypothetical protein
MKRPWSVPLSVLALTVSATIAGCAVPSATGTSDSSRSAAPASARDTELVKTSVWANEKTRLLRYKAHMGTMPGSKKAPGNSGDWVYPSLPINVTGNGTYEVSFGPLDASWDFPKHPTAVVFEWPWDTHFSVVPAGMASIANVNGKRYFRIGISVTKYTRSYQGFTGYIY